MADSNSVNRIAVIIGSLAIAIVMLACSLCFVVYRRRILANRKGANAAADINYLNRFVL